MRNGKVSFTNSDLITTSESPFLTSLEFGHFRVRSEIQMRIAIFKISTSGAAAAVSARVSFVCVMSAAVMQLATGLPM